MNSLTRFSRCMAAFAILAALIFSPRNQAQDAVGPFISTVGTSVRDANGRDWAYLLWTANAPTLLNGRAHAIYAKSGDANSPALFNRVAIVSLQTEAVTLDPLFRRAALLGENTNVLEMDIDALFGKFVPGNLPLPEKLSAIVRGGLKEEKHFGRMILLSRTHPSVAMALGFAHAELIPAGQTTFEVREFDRATQKDGAVIGRVTVTAGAPTVLPAPGPPVELKHDNARGHLNAQLRWGVPDDLRRLSLLQHGFNVWRVRKDFSDARNWRTTPPKPNELVSFSASNTAVRRVNYLPLMISKTFDIPKAADFLADPTTFFVADDNDRGRSNVITTADFTNGARFVYFVTARDILGRDGTVSPGTEVQICNKLPPDAPHDVEVSNDSVWVGDGNRQRLRVTWPQAENAPLAEQKIKAYWIYRWKSVAELRLKQSDPEAGRIAIVNHVAGQALNTYLDNGAGAPTPANALGKTFYYTVRSEDDGACDGNLSPHSAPVFGVLRDRTGPPAPTGDLIPKCVDPVARYITTGTNLATVVGSFDNTFQFTITGSRADKRIAWMSFKAEVRAKGQTTALQTYTSPRMNFGTGVPFVGFPIDVPESFADHNLFVTATAGFASGESGSDTRTEPINIRHLAGDTRIIVLFAGETIPQPKDVPCRSHMSVGPSDELLPINVTVQPAAGSKEVRVYRRVDDGPLDLIYQRPLNDLGLIAIPDDALPHGGGKVCYYACTLDEHGNSSPLTQLGCTMVFENNSPPRPQLSPIVSIPPEAAPQMEITFFCPSVNVERFEVGIATFGDFINPNCSPGFLQHIPEGPEPNVEPIFSQVSQAGGFPPLNINYKFRRFLTPHPGGGFGSNDRFTIPIDVLLDRRYIVYVKSIGRSGSRSEASNMETFFWQAAPLEQANVPWPARPLPPVGNSFGIDFEVSLTPACGALAAPGAPVVRIALKGAADRQLDCPQNMAFFVDPNSLLPTNNVGESIFPVALFRQQVANDNFPTVSGDVSQVTPLMETIAWGAQGDKAVIYDPYVLIETGQRIVGVIQGMYLRDTQPIISGSRYRYFLARFTKLGEIAEVIPAANELEIP